MNYGELKLLVQSYLHRTDSEIVDLIPDFIDAGISRMNGQLRIQEMIATNEGFIFTNPFDLPADFLELREASSVSGTGRIQMRSVSKHELNSYNDLGTTPLIYSIDGLSLETRASAAGIDVRLIYYAKITTPVNDTATDAVLTRYPMLWLYGALIEGFSWAQNDDQHRKSVDLFVAELDLANRASSMSELGESPKMRGAVQGFI